MSFHKLYLMQDTIYYLIIVIYYFWYFYVKNVILGLGDLFPCFQEHLMLFRSNLILVMVRYQLGVILEYIFLFVKFYESLKQASKSVNVFNRLLSIKYRLLSNSFFGGFQLSPHRFKIYYQKLTIQFLFHQREIGRASCRERV